MTTRMLQSVRGRKIRVTRLDPCGTPIIDDCSTVVSSGFISVAVTPDITTGRTYQSRNIWGDLCVSDSDPDDIRSAAIQIELCSVHPDLLMVMTGREPVLFDGEAIGFRETSVRNWDAYSVEVWTKAVGTCDQWAYLLIPYIRNGRLSGSVTVEDGPLTISTQGVAYPVYGWGEGPYVQNPFRMPFLDGDLYGMVLTNVPPPTDVDLSLCTSRLVDGAMFRIDACESEIVNA